MRAPQASSPRPHARKRPTRAHRPIIPPIPFAPLRHRAIALNFRPPKQKRLLRISREAFSVGRGNRASAALISRTSYALAGIGTFAAAPKRDRRLPGIKGPVPPPLWIRAVNYSTVMELARPIRMMGARHFNGWNSTYGRAGLSRADDSTFANLSGARQGVDRRA